MNRNNLCLIVHLCPEHLGIPFEEQKKNKLVYIMYGVCSALRSLLPLLPLSREILVW